ncbi:MAG: DUF4389 domain-containing protein [Flavobacteriales bacterium]|jgi:hypothetical protein|nr:DUF4389 domain-containing protein [Flavobacteriales bacterium]MBT3963416.1 DUF4389 domain-containing protein [Flavobacteriales bacterium]MBT4704958.1 DUF4389 domain-containing protein [Flavobacteriales bacterium]MBT4929733.1 DUF4389 domain-containing protein [Flavobacteriales bacterium]MBT5132825.1 DUF4389 domain-containing protein [Flavobacteriales bacterium]
MQLDVHYQESYSRGQLLLRSILGFIYLFLPHSLLLGLFGIWSGILQFISFWMIVFTGKFPESFFDFQVKMMRWNLRVMTRYYNLSDGYPAFGINGTDDTLNFEVEYPENLSRSTALAKALFGWIYVGIPHGIYLLGYSIACSFASLWAFFVVLFTGTYPKNIHTFIVGFLRWSYRVNLYLSYMTDDYPPFTGKQNPSESSSLRFHTVKDTLRLMPAIAFISIGWILLIFSGQTFQNEKFVLASFAVFTAGVFVLFYSTRELTKIQKYSFSGISLLLVVWLAFSSFNSIRKPIEFQNEKEKRYEHVVQRLKDIRTAELAYKATYHTYQGNIDSLVHFVKNDSLLFIKAFGEVPDTMTLEAAIKAGIASRDTVYVNAQDSLFGSQDPTDRAHPFNVDSLSTVPFTGGAIFALEAGSVMRSSVRVPVFQATDTKPFDTRDILQVGSMNDPKTNGNWE